MKGMAHKQMDGQVIIIADFGVLWVFVAYTWVGSYGLSLVGRHIGRVGAVHSSHKWA